MSLRLPAAPAFAILAATLGIELCAFCSAASAAPPDLRAERQASIAHVLAGASGATVQAIRATCAAGQEVESITRRRALGLAGLPDAADYCVSALTRLGRDGTLGFVRDTRGDRPTPALAFDNGFVAAFRKREPVTPELPAMAALKPVAERCLGQREPDTELCSAAGYAFGVRAYHGETVIVR